MFKAIRTLQTQEPRKKLVVKGDDGITTDEKVQAEKITAYFKKVFQKDGEQIMTDIPPTEMKTKFTKEEVEKAIVSLKNNKSPGCDGLKAELLKHAADKLHEHIAMLLNTIATTGCCPTEIKRGILIPIPKPGKKQGPPENLRPIILLCLEEIEFIEKEKSSYLKYYADSILPTLERKKESCVLLKSRQAGITITNKYRLQDLMDDDVANGVLALINKGIHFAKSMLRQGFEISTTRQTAMPSTSSSVGPCLVTAPEVESNVSNYENDYACANSADVGDPDVYQESEDDEDDDISVDVNNIPTTRKSEKFPFFVNFNDNELNRDGCMILYNEGFSQGRISGRNGSNACSFICVLFAKVYMHNKTPLGVHCREDSSVNVFIEGIMRFAMQQGNILYDYYRKSLPDRYCSIAEVCDQLKNMCPFIVREELYVSLKDEHYLSTLKGRNAERSKR
eukprot:gene21016-23068_t